MKRFEFNKLVRNKLPLRMREEGLNVVDKKLETSDYILKLWDKLLEEANEVIECESPQHLKVELADLLEVILAIGAAHQISFEDIQQVCKDKREANGFFSSDSFIDYIEVNESNYKVIDFLKNKNRSYKYIAS